MILLQFQIHANSLNKHILQHKLLNFLQLIHCSQSSVNPLKRIFGLLISSPLNHSNKTVYG